MDQNRRPLEHTIALGEGASEAIERSVVLLHGFPDNPAIWRGTAQHLRAKGYRVITVALPGFEEGEVDTRAHSFEAVTERLQATLEHTDALGATLIGHDWGAIFCYRLLRTYPKAAGRLVTLEVGAGPRSFALTLFVLAYHALLNLAYRLGEGLGDRLMAWLCRRMPRPSYPDALEPKAHHGWLYRQAWRQGSEDGPWPYYFQSSIAKWTPPEALPVCFLYGEDGPSWLRFHTKAWRDAVTSHNEQSRAVGLPGGHWCLLEHPEAFYSALDDFLKASA